MAPVQELVDRVEQMGGAATGGGAHETDTYITEARKRVEVYRDRLEHHEVEARRYRALLEATEAALEVFDRPQPQPPVPGTQY